jgi:hypothetical protein
MASYGSWPSIRQHGLLSTSELLSLFEITADRRCELLTQQRKHSVPISHPVHGNAVLRDQKPLSAKNLARCLVDCDEKTWYQLLNERVFFWLDRDRLMTLMSAGEYAGQQHTVLELDSLGLVTKYRDAIEVATMNTGNTRPFPHPRGRETFRSLQQFDYERRRRLPDYSAVVELTVLRGVSDIREHVTRVLHADATEEGAFNEREILFTL